MKLQGGSVQGKCLIFCSNLSLKRSLCVRELLRQSQSPYYSSLWSDLPQWDALEPQFFLPKSWANADGTVDFRGKRAIHFLSIFPKGKLQANFVIQPKFLLYGKIHLPFLPLQQFLPIQHPYLLMPENDEIKYHRFAIHRLKVHFWEHFWLDESVDVLYHQVYLFWVQPRVPYWQLFLRTLQNSHFISNCLLC